MAFLRKFFPLAARVCLVIWALSLSLFVGILLLAPKTNGQASAETGKFVLIIVIVGVISFALAALFAVLGVILKPGERRLSPESPSKAKGKAHTRMSFVWLPFLLLLIIASFLFGRGTGLESGIKIGEDRIKLLLPKKTPTPSPTPTPVGVQQQAPAYRTTAWDGPELWEAVNKRRVEHGVGSLGRNDLLCSIASFRLNQLLELGKLDNHAGFNVLWQNKASQYYWVFQKYNLWEFIINVPNGTALDAVNWWDNTMGHQTLLRGGQFTIGCTYAANGFGVAIAGF